MATQHEGGDVFDGNLEFLGQEMAEPRTVQNAGHADDLAVGQARGVAQDLNHGVQRVGDADDEGVGRVLLDARTHGLHDRGVDADQVVAAHARLAGDAGGDDADIGATDGGVAVRALHVGIKAFDGARFSDVQGLALGNAVDDVEKHYVAQFLEADQMGQRAPDVTGADERDFVACHF